MRPNSPISRDPQILAHQWSHPGPDPALATRELARRIVPYARSMRAAKQPNFA